MAEVFPAAEATRLQAEVTSYVRNGTFRGWKTLLRRTPQLEEPTELADWEVHLLRAALHSDIAQSRAELERARALAPDPLPGRITVAQRIAAREDASDLVQLYPEEPDVSVAVWGEYNADADVELLRRQVRAHPDNPSLLLLAGNVELAEGQVDAADALARRGSELAPWSLALASLQMRISLEQHECATALEHYERMLALGSERERPEAMERMRAFERIVRACKPR